MTTSTLQIILAGSVSQGNQPLTIAEDYDQLITDTSAFDDSGSKNPCISMPAQSPWRRRHRSGAFFKGPR